jgi:hypothetical protein
MKRNLAVCVVAAVVACGLGVAAWGIHLPSFPVLPVSSPQYYLVTQRADGVAFSGDYDWFEVTLVGGAYYKISLSVPWSADIDISIYDENNNLVGSGTAGRGQSETVYISPIWTGPFFIKVQSHSGSGSYTLSLWKRA